MWHHWFKAYGASGGEHMETLESIGIFIAGLGILFAGLSGTIFMLASTDEVTKRTGRQSKEEKKQE